jgi:hypothetical protein
VTIALTFVALSLLAKVFTVDEPAAVAAPAQPLSAATAAR